MFAGLLARGKVLGVIPWVRMRALLVGGMLVTLRLLRVLALRVTWGLGPGRFVVVRVRRCRRVLMLVGNRVIGAECPILVCSLLSQSAALLSSIDKATALRVLRVVGPS